MTTGTLDHALSAEVDALFADYVDGNQPGAYCVVVEQGEIVHGRGYGLASVEFALPWTIDTATRIASITKHMLASAVLRLEDEATLSLEDDVRDSVPELPDYGTPITFRDLLANRSGLRDDEELATFAGFPERAHYSLDHLFDLVCRQKALNFRPGTHTLYSNTSFRLVALAIERITGESLHDIMVSRLFRPLGMRDTYPVRSIAPIVPNLATGYAVDEAGDAYRYEAGGESSGDGAVVSTVADMVRWVGQLRDNTLEIPDYLDRLVEKDRDEGRLSRYGLGVDIERLGKQRYLGHGGSYLTHRSLLLHLLDVPLSVLVFANRSDADAKSLALQVTRLWLDEQPALCAFDADLWRGWYVNREHGYAAELLVDDSRPVLRLVDAAMVLDPDDGGFSSRSGHASYRLTLGDPGPGFVLDGNWGTAMAFEPATLGLVDNALRAAICGRYYSDELDAMWCIAGQPGEALLLTRGLGWAHAENPLTLHQLAPDVLLAKDDAPGLRLDRMDVSLGLRFDANKTVSGFVASAAHSRDIAFTRC